MRLYMKVVAMLMAASAIQLSIGGPGQWLDETQFAIRVYVADRLGIPPQSPILVDAADQLRARTAARSGVTLPALGPAVARAPLPEFAAGDACDETDDAPDLCALAG